MFRIWLNVRVGIWGEEVRLPATDPLPTLALPEMAADILCWLPSHPPIQILGFSWERVE